MTKKKPQIVAKFLASASLLCLINNTTQISQLIEKIKIDINLELWDKTITFDKGYVTYVKLPESETVKNSYFLTKGNRLRAKFSRFHSHEASNPPYRKYA